MIWKGVVVACSRYIPGVCLEGQKNHEKALVRIASVLAKIRTEHLHNTILEPYLLRILFNAIFNDRSKVFRMHF
jgi:hypothetical protein